MSDLNDFLRDELAMYSDSRFICRLARKAGVDKTTLYGLRDGRHLASVDTLEKVLDAMDYDIVLRKRSNRTWAV